MRRSGGTCVTRGSPISRFPVTCNAQRVLDTLRYLFLIKHFFFFLRRGKNQSNVNFKTDKRRYDQKKERKKTTTINGEKPEMGAARDNKKKRKQKGISHLRHSSASRRFQTGFSLTSKSRSNLCRGKKKQISVIFPVIKVGSEFLFLPLREIGHLEACAKKTCQHKENTAICDPFG